VQTVIKTFSPTNNRMQELKILAFVFPFILAFWRGQIMRGRDAKGSGLCLCLGIIPVPGD
jgi:hypothetical protein